MNDILQCFFAPLPVAIYIHNLSSISAHFMLECISSNQAGKAKKKHDFHVQQSTCHGQVQKANKSDNWLKKRNILLNKLYAERKKPTGIEVMRATCTIFTDYILTHNRSAWLRCNASLQKKTYPQHIEQSFLYYIHIYPMDPYFIIHKYKLYK